MGVPGEWFSALLDSLPDVYFRYAIEPARRVAYVSPAILALTGRSAAEFREDPDLCARVVARGERHLLRRVLRSRRGLVVRLHILRDGVAVPVELRTVAIVRNRRLVAVEGVARLDRRVRLGDEPGEIHRSTATMSGAAHDLAEPIQQRLGALLVEVHDLLHRVLPPSTRRASGGEGRCLRIGALAFDVERLTVVDAGAAVDLTTREAMLLRYLLERVGRVVTRQQLLTDVWGYQFTGDDRTVDVHVSRLRRKLPSLRGRLVALRHIGYRLDDEVSEGEGRPRAAVRRAAGV